MLRGASPSVRTLASAATPTTSRPTISQLSTNDVVVTVRRSKSDPTGGRADVRHRRVG